MAKYKCKWCEDYFEEFIKVPAGRFCTEAHMFEWISEQQDKATAKRIAKAKADKVKSDKADRKQHREDKERVRSRARWYTMLQTLVNQYVVHVRDKLEPCCTCGNTDPSIKYDCGHHLTRAARPELRFELTNLAKQCSIKCNVHGSGMRPEFKEFIIQKHGQAHYDWLEGPHPLLKDQFPHYLDIKAEISRYRKILREAALVPNSPFNY